MSLKDFLRQLHDEPDRAKPAGWEADWEDAPLPYKLYRGLPAVRLPAHRPLTLSGAKTGGDAPAASGSSLVSTFGYLLWYAYGLSQASQTVVEPDGLSGPYDGYTQTSYRRFVPSGGGLYPSELYMYLKAEDQPAGIYHYDAAHHRLILLREGNYDLILGKALGDRCPVSSCTGVAFITTFFWKNFFKYNNFAYRLQGLDAGVLLGQLLEVSGRFGFASGVQYQFLDEAVNHLLGLQSREESVYAVIPLAPEGVSVWSASGGGSESGETPEAAALCRELPEIRHGQYMRSQQVLPYPKLIELNEAAFLQSKAAFRPLRKSLELSSGETARYELPQVERAPYDLASVCRKRQSPEADYVLSTIPLAQLAALLLETCSSSAYCNDLGEPTERRLPEVFLYGCFYGVEGIPDGAYRYDPGSHSLRLVRVGDHRAWLQRGMSLDNINLFQVPLTFHVAGDRDFHHAELGCRGYRIQQMEAGLLVQRLLLAAGALGYGGRPLLGFDVSSSDELYGMASRGLTSLIQIPIGSYRGRSRLEGSLGS